VIYLSDAIILFPDIRSDQVHLFIDKLREKRQTKVQQEQAAYTVSLYFELQRKSDNGTHQNLCLAYLQVISRKIWGRFFTFDK